MLIVQKFHSIHEIDPEFITNLEVLLQEDIASFDTLIQRHDRAPQTDVFTYFLFFGPTQNAPIGFAQLCLRSIPTKTLLPWWKRWKFWNKSHESWKQATWQVGDGSGGLCVFDPRFARSGKEKMLELFKEYEKREDIKAQSFYTLRGLQETNVSWPLTKNWSKEFFVLEPLFKSSKTYEDYLKNLTHELQSHVKQSWKDLHSKSGIALGDYPCTSETPHALPIEKDLLDVWEKWGAQVLTFEKDNKVLGCLLLLKGRNGNVFFEPFPFESEGQAIVHDELYTQYALLKFFDMPEARKCHLMKFGVKLVFEDKNELQFFQEQGFQCKTVNQTFFSRMEELLHPL